MNEAIQNIVEKPHLRHLTFSKILLRWIKNPDAPITMQTVVYEFGTGACDVESSLNETHFTFDGVLNGENGAANSVISRINKVEVPFRTCSYNSYIS